MLTESEGVLDLIEEGGRIFQYLKEIMDTSGRRIEG